MIDDVFCKIINKELNADIVHEADDWLAIRDIHPQAPTHVLLVPKKHIQDLSALSDADISLIGHMMLGAATVAQKLGLDYKGFRLIMNQGEHGGQLVPHLHFHLLGGKPLGSKIVK